MKRCLVHIGVPKTGSTALQKFLAANQEGLSRHGVSYPDVSLRGYGHHDFAFLVAGGYPHWATPQARGLDGLIEDLGRAAADTSNMLVLSSENFYLFPNPHRLKQALNQAGIADDWTISIVVYVRRQDEALVSWHNQMVKAQGYTGTLGEAIAAERGIWDYAVRLADWASAFGRGNLIVRPYQPEDLVGGDIRRDFLSLADLPAGDFPMIDEAVNTRINNDIVEFQRQVNRLPMSPQQKRRFHRQLMALTAASAGTGLFDETDPLRVEDRRALLAGFAAGNAEIARTYLARPQLFSPISAGGMAGSPAMIGLTCDKLAGILGWLLATRDEEK